MSRLMSYQELEIMALETTIYFFFFFFLKQPYICLGHIRLQICKDKSHLDNEIRDTTLINQFANYPWYVIVSIVMYYL